MNARVRLGPLEMDRLTFAGAIDAIEALVAAGNGGAVFTPNVDHVVLANGHEGFRDAYQQASLSLVDGMPVLWASRLLRDPLPEKISGSDLVVPLMKRAAERGLRVYLLGGAEGSAEEAARRLRTEYGVNVVGTDDARIDVARADDDDQRAIVERVRAAEPHLLLVGLGAPKQELWIARHKEALRPAVALGVGASLDFLAGKVKRAPGWMSRAGLEWLYRLSREPRRLWRRYLVNDPAFLFILWGEVRRRRSEG